MPEWRTHKMIRVGGVHLFGAAFAACVGASATFGGAKIDVPSGQAVTLADIIRDAPLDAEGVVRFRFLAPAIARANPQVSPRQAALIVSTSSSAGAALNESQRRAVEEIALTGEGLSLLHGPPGTGKSA